MRMPLFNSKKNPGWLAAFPFCIFLASCGGGSSSNSTNTNQPTSNSSTQTESANSANLNIPPISGGNTVGNSGTSSSSDESKGGIPGSTPATPPATQYDPTVARFFEPFSLAVDGSGNVYVSDSHTLQLRKIEANGRVRTIIPSPDGFFYSLAADKAGNLYGASGNEIVRIDANGNITSIAGVHRSAEFADGTGANARFGGPQAITVGQGGNIYVADTGNSAIRKVTPAGEVSTIYKANYMGEWLNSPTAIAVDAAGAVYSGGHGEIWKIANGKAEIYVGGPIYNRDGVGRDAGLSQMRGMALDADGNLYVAATTWQGLKYAEIQPGSGTVRKVTPQGVVSTLAGNFNTTEKGSVDGIGAAARFLDPQQMVLHPDGNLYLVDTFAQTIRRVTLDGVVTTYAGKNLEGGSVDTP